MRPITPFPNIDAVRLDDRDDIDATTKGYSMINPMALIEFNTKEGAFIDPAIRRAISTAIDRRFMIDTIFFDTKAGNECA